MFWVTFWQVIAGITVIGGLIVSLRIGYLAGGVGFLLTLLLAGMFMNFSESAKKNYEQFLYTQNIIFAGKIVNRETSEWPNDRLVLLYLHGKEIGRAISATSKFAENELGVQDGLFTIPVSNTYVLPPDSFTIDESVRLITGTYSGGIYTWFEIEEGRHISIAVPSKNLTYVIKSVSGDKSTLPPQLLTAKLTRLTNTNEIIVPLSEDKPSEPQNIPGADVNVGDIQYDTESQTVILNKITVPINNCGGSSVIAQDFSQTQTFIHEYQEEISGQVGVEASLPIPIIWPKLMATLQAKYGFEQGQIDTRTVAYHMEAQPRTNQAYIITWKEVWESGMAQTTAINDVITIPFKVKTNLIYEVDSKKLDCN